MPARSPVGSPGGGHWGLDQEEPGSAGRGRALGKLRVDTQARRWASGDRSQGDRRGRGSAGPGSEGGR